MARLAKRAEPVELQPGEPVYYWKDPQLFGEMEVRAKRKTDDRYACLVDPDRGRSNMQIFDREELRRASEMLVGTA